MPRTSRCLGVNEVFENEVKFLENSDHQNITKLYHSNDHANILNSNLQKIPVYAIELELAENGDLFDTIQKTGNFSEKDARFYFHQLVNGIEYIHDKGYWHRDIKTENLLLDSEFNLKIADFGFSTNSECCEESVGTLAYMPPEVLK
jgi:serine/threonine protein kinase